MYISLIILNLILMGINFYFYYSQDEYNRHNYKLNLYVGWFLVIVNAINIGLLIG